jgi:hypothetical protein
LKPAAAWLRPASACTALALVLAIFAVYWPGLGGGFVFDDIPNIVDNTELHVRTLAWQDWMTAIFSSPASKLQRPLAMLSFAINHYFTGADARPMKLTNLAIHALNALLVFWLVRTLLRSPRLSGLASAGRQEAIAWFAAAAWALHPINLMAVLFVVQRMESLCHAFVFLGLVLYLRGRQRQLRGEPGWTPITLGLVVCTGIGLLAKESAVLLPLYAFLVECCLLRFDSARPGEARQLRWLYGVCLVLPAIAGLAWLLPAVMGPHSFSNRNFDLHERLLTEGRVVMQYLSWTFYPDLNKLGLYHDDFPVSRGLFSPPTTALSLAAIAALLGLAAWLRRYRPLSSLGIAWFFAAQALTATVIPLELMFEHRNYFASVGSCLVLADLLLLWPARADARRLGVVAASLLLLLFAFGTWLRAKEWTHPVRFVQSEAAKHPLSPRANYEVARMLVILSHYRPDSPYTRPAMTAIEKALAVPGSGVLPEQAALIFAARTGHPLREEWWDSLESKLAKEPIGQQSLASIAAMVECSNENLCRFPPDRMLAVFGAALSRGPHPEVFNIYGSYALNTLKDPGLSLRLWRESVRLNPNEPQYRINLCRLLIVLREPEQAREQIAALRRIGRLGQYESLALQLEARLAAAQAGSR